MIGRREFIALLSISSIAGPGAAIAQQPKSCRIDLLSALAPPSDTSPLIAPLIRGLDKFGNVLGRNLVFERRGADGKLDRLPQLAQELVESKIDVTVVTGFSAALAVRQASAVPAVAFAAGDPVATRLVQSMARPGGNMRRFKHPDRADSEKARTAKGLGTKFAPRGDALECLRSRHDAALSDLRSSSQSYGRIGVRDQTISKRHLQR